MTTTMFSMGGSFIYELTDLVKNTGERGIA